MGAAPVVFRYDPWLFYRRLFWGSALLLGVMYAMFYFGYTNREKTPAWLPAAIFGGLALLDLMRNILFPLLTEVRIDKATGQTTICRWLRRPQTLPSAALTSCFQLRPMKTGAVEVWHLTRGSRPVAKVRVDTDGWTKAQLMELSNYFVK